MERSLKSRRPRTWEPSGLEIRGLASAVLVALLAGCSSSNSPGASGGSGGKASSVAGGSTTGGQTTVGGTTSLAGATATGGSTASGGVTTETGGSTTTSSGGLAAAGTAQAGNTSTGGVASTGGSASGGVVPTGGTTKTGGIVSAGGSNTNPGGTTATGGTAATGGDSATGGSTRTGGATSMGGNSASGGSTRTGGVTRTGGSSATGGSSGGATGTAGTTSACGAASTTYDTSAIATTCPAAVPGGITSAFCSCVNEGQGYKTGMFSVANNVWGSNPGPECVWATNTTLWGFASNQPQTGGVKSYPNIGYSPKLLISSINTYTSSFDITVPGNVGSWEAAYDIWLRTPGGGNTRIELMIWMYTYKTGPISSVVATTKPTIGNYTWTVHYGSNGSNATISFVNTSPSGGNANVTSGTVDVKGILDWLIANNNTQYGIFDNTWTLDQVQWGFEISGDGGSPQEFINNCFSVSST
jgi:Glycosyl hydrolase family 12